jgi:hypothetical protein
MAKHDIFIGIDFGTSFSKVCYNLDDTIYVYKVNNDPFIPTEVFYSVDKKEIYLRKPSSEINICKARYFKYSMAFDGLSMEEISKKLPFGYTYKKLATMFSIFYLSFIIRDVKNEINNKLVGKIDITSINWEINMSAPINDYRGTLHQLYQNVLITANILSEKTNSKDIMNINEIDKIYTEIINHKSNENINYDTLNIYPELFIEAVFFTNNPGIDIGSYIIMDIGGGTVDVGILWKREWEGRILFDLVVVNILKYGLDVLCNKLITGKGPDEKAILKILMEWAENKSLDKEKYINLEQEKEFSDNFLSNIRRMLEIEATRPVVGLNDINYKRIYYSGGGFNFQWYKQKISLINSNIIEDKYFFSKLPVNYIDKSTFHRIIIAMELAQPEETIKKNMGSTVIITDQNIIPNNIENGTHTSNIINEKPEHSYYDLQDRQREMYGDDPI